jgi:hypothetical protein|nr:MAG TPA: Protein of unknown function (DUF2577) [Caudoviricetes sp.]DAT71573.1 MAG TPA: Protein of unknown function (DUF2577) [Caudoviricetes sp.]
MNQKQQKIIDFFKKFENQDFKGIWIGKVLNPAPDLKIDLGNGIEIDTDKIYEAEEKTAGYTRKFEQEGNIEITIDEIEITDNSNKDSGGNIHKKISGTGKMNGNFKSSGTNSWTDTLKEGDSVMMISFVNEESWLLIDKVTKYKENKELK